jgi:hypothetical protein
VLRIKKKFKNKTMSNGLLGYFNSSDITIDTINKYMEKGFAHIFEEVCDTCEKLKCKCK